MTLTQDDKAIIRYELNRAIQQLTNRRIHAETTDPDDVPLINEQIASREAIVSKLS